MIKHLILYLILLFPFQNGIKAQIAFDGINIQGQFFGILQNESTINLESIILSNSGDTIWYEKHENIILSNQTSFEFTLGLGTFISGQLTNFKLINWYDVSEVKLNYYDINSSYEIGTYQLKPQPFSLHSLTNLTSPNIIDLMDFSPTNINLNAVFKFDGNIYIQSIDEIGDSINFASYTNSALYADTIFYVTNTLYTDSSTFNFKSDSANYAFLSNNSTFSDSSLYADTSNFSNFSINNWGILGNSGSTNDFLGTTSNYELVLKTNSNPRLTFGNNSNIFNSSGNNGFSFDTPNGFLVTSTGGQLINQIGFDHLYFNGNSSSFRGGSAISNIDTLNGSYSFSWGKNTGTNGSYSTVFGYNTYGDSSLIFGVTYDAISSFAMGKNCRTSYVCVAIGDSATANFYRNVAIGKNVTANKASAAFAIGNNVVSTGATSWAGGHNITASGHFSTALGSNASTNNLSGGFIYGDHSTTDTVKNTAIYQFVIRADSGFVFYTTSDLSMSVTLNNGDGSWNSVSDVSKKENISELNSLNLTTSILKIPIYTWSYKKQTNQHIGPMAQDFNSYFNVGELPNYINMSDFDGVILSGIKSANQKLDKETKDKEVIILEKEIDTEQEKLKELEQKIKLLYEKMDH